MKQLIKNNETGEITIQEVPLPSLNANYIRVKNIYSAVSVGTEKSAIKIAKKSIFQKAKERPKEFKKVLGLIEKEGFWSGYRIAVEKLGFPSTLGYSSVGEVIDVGEGVKDFSAGDIVACGGSGHSEIISVPVNLCSKVPKNVDMKEASFTTIGSIALQGVRQVNAKIGETVLVIGLGLIGQITIELLKANGCTPIGVDIDKNKVKLARSRGNKAYSRTDPYLSENFLLDTNKRGFDSAIITASTNSEDPLSLASEVVRQKATITVVGAVKLSFERKNFYEKELTLNLSKSYGPGRYDYQYEHKGIDYPIGYVRFTEKRNMETFLQLLSNEQISIKDLITSVHNFKDSSNIYKSLSSSSQNSEIGVLFKYPKETNFDSTIFNSNATKFLSGNVSVGLIGAGGYCQRFILPLLKENKKVNFIGVCTNKGLTSNHICKKYNFTYATTDPNKIFEDKNIDLVIISTRHDTHAEFIIKSLEAKKKVYCDKPMAINEEDLFKIKEVFDTGSDVTIGYNRRFSSLSAKAKRIFKERQSPLVINYVVHTSTLPSDHWVYDNEEGGGRILGEICHFVDFSSYIIGHNCISVYSNSIGEKEDISSVLKYSDGSIANIIYTTHGDLAEGKESIEIIGSNKVVRISDFKSIKMFANNKLRYTKNLKYLDKGRDKMFDMLSDFSNSIPFESLFNTSLVTFRILDSINEGKIKKIN